MELTRNHIYHVLLLCLIETTGVCSQVASQCPSRSPTRLLQRRHTLLPLDQVPPCSALPPSSRPLHRTSTDSSCSTDDEMLSEADSSRRRSHFLLPLRVWIGLGRYRGGLWFVRAMKGCWEGFVLRYVVWMCGFCIMCSAGIMQGVGFRMLEILMGIKVRGLYSLWKLILSVLWIKRMITLSVL